MQKKESPVFHFLTIGIIKLLWIHSKTALLLFVLPTWFFIFMQLGIVIGLSISDIAFAIGFYCLSALCFFLMLGVMWLGFQAAQGICRIIGLVQIAFAVLFCLISTYLNIFRSSGPPFSFDTVGSVVSAFTMFALFIGVVLIDISRSFTERHAME